MPVETALELSDISKRYGATLALQDASFRVAKGSVHALIGENGAGKSTLVKILSGTVQPDSGTVSVAGVQAAFSTSRDALKAGIATAYQELTLVPHLTVAQNLLLGREPKSRLGLITNNRLAAAARVVLADWDLADVDPDALVASLSLGVRQQIELVRTLSRNADVLLLDEPTAALGAVQVDWLFKQIRRVRAGGGTVVFISHRMGEVREICDQVTVLRNGHQVKTFSSNEASDAEVVEMMIGHTLERVLAAQPTGAPTGAPILTVTNLQSEPNLRGASFTLHEGEILGVAALQGHGQLELFMTLFGGRKSTGGTIEIAGKEVRPKSPHDAVHLGLGISLVPEDRKAEGVMTNMSGLVNVTLPSLSKFAKFGFLDKKAEKAAALDLFSTLNVKTSALDQDVSSLSGGNQQKLAIGKWLVGDGRIMLLHDPTRGVDIGTKTEIFTLMSAMAAEGRSILFYSTDIEELLGVTNSILVMYRGTVVAHLSGDDCTRNAVLLAMLGGTSDAAPDAPESKTPPKVIPPSIPTSAPGSAVPTGASS